ncbi:TonB-dependent receptor domain-containing protein [Chitinophaga qingshengii]|uniref:TonB-dependent receptor n=1 Tax=Chitinophaga qingshengii TaxID=1569794 RepID=A0ABR7TSD3_9BACT|nr:TonB-dependent receptor [Chitinophaga qingshengii]MBC9932913.1 TonB-dependent receptor [Chitinophaga qingshengii]
MKRTSLLTFILFIYVTTYLNKAFSQAGNTFYSIKGTFTTADNTPASDVVVQLLHAADKKLVKLEYTDAKGNFSFDHLPAGQYLLATQSMAYTSWLSAAITMNQDIRLGTLRLQPTTTTLREATVTAAKPFVQQQYDKTTLNVAGSISAAGSTALEVLEKAPGITIDQNDNIAMRGRQGVLVMMDGKLVPMSGQELANLLRNLSANQIEKIDLITNPSAKYDAAGNAGIIDIRLRKGTQSGTSGNVSLSYGQGVYPKINPAFSFNSKMKQINVFGSYNYNYRQFMNDLKIERQFYDGSDHYTGGNNYDNYFRMGYGTHNARLGADYNLTQNITVGVVANGIFTKGNISSNSNAHSFDAAQQPSGSFTTRGDNHPQRNNGSINLNYKHKLDTSGRELAIDLDYARFDNNELQNYRTAYFTLQQQPAKADYVLFGDLRGNLNIKSVKADYTQPLKTLGGKLDAGIKSSWVKADNDVQFFDRSSGTDILDAGKSNRFVYDENINAAYLNASGKWSRLSLQLGLRMENTIAKGLQVTNKESFDRNYTQFFPSGYVGYMFNQTHDLGISVSRRINRPSYRDLNPFKVFLDPLTYATGNPYLKPEITNSFELTHTFKEKYITKIGYSTTTDNILIVLSPDAAPNSVIQTGHNLARYNYYSLSFSVPFTVGKWLNSTNEAQAYYGEYKGDLANTQLNASRVSFNLNSINNITLNPVTTMELTATYNSRSYYGFLDVQGFWFMSVGAQRQLWQRKASIKLNLSDVFFTNNTHAVTRLTGYGETFFQRRDSRVLTLTFNYKFGGNTSGGGNKKTGGAEDEKRRAG